jgi:uncharacterized membrane protein
VASALNLSASTVSRSLRHLRFLGLVSIVPKGKSSIVWPKYLGGSPSDYLKEAQSP